MLDNKRLRDDPEAIAKQLQIKGYEFPMARYRELEEQRRQLQTHTESLQNERKTRSKAIGKAKAAGEDVAEIMAGIDELGAQLDTAKHEFQTLQQRLNALLEGIPNVPDESVPAGADEDSNVMLKQWGSPTPQNFESLDHVALSTNGGLDFEAATRITGSRFVVMRGVYAQLQRALTQFMLDLHTQEHGYQEVYVPFIVNSHSLRGTGQLPKMEEDLFKLSGEQGYYLAPTAEVPVTNLFRDEILDAASLPVRYVCHSPCFRSEAGSHGRDTRGIIRQHQFEKVELVQATHPAESWDALESLTVHAEAVLERLQLPYRRMLLCGGDLSFASAKTYDLEVWLPGQGKYREISSCSNFQDFQARRMQARFRPAAGGKPELLHTLNGSALAVGRTLVAVLENYQDAGGQVAIPEVLQPYMGGLQTINAQSDTT